MKKFAKNYMEQLRDVNKSDGMFIKTSCHDRIAETDTYTSHKNMSVSAKNDELHIGRIGAFDDIV